MLVRSCQCGLVVASLYLPDSAKGEERYLTEIAEAEYYIRSLMVHADDYLLVGADGQTEVPRCLPLSGALSRGTASTTRSMELLLFATSLGLRLANTFSNTDDADNLLLKMAYAWTLSHKATDTRSQII